MDRSVNFYNGVLGMEIVEQKRSIRGSRLVFLRFPDTECDLELCSFPSSGEVKVPEDLVHLAFQVQDLEECIDRLNKANVPITEGPKVTDNGTRFVFTEDPDKYEIELIQYPDGNY